MSRPGAAASVGLQVLASIYPNPRSIPLGPLGEAVTNHDDIWQSR